MASVESAAEAICKAMDLRETDHSVKVGVVLLNWNGGDLTIPCIRSLYASTCRPWKILVFDNASNDGSPDQIEQEFPHLTVMRSDLNLGFSKGNNIGIKRLLDDGIDYVWVLNNDTTVEPTCLEYLLRVAKLYTDVAAVGAKILYAKPPHLIWYAGAWLNPFTFYAPHHGAGKPAVFGPQQPVYVDFITGCSMLIPRSALLRIGLFDEDFFAYGEDLDWCIRARKQGLRLIYVPDGVLYHEVSASIRRNTLIGHQGTASPRAHYLTTRNSLLVIRKYARSWHKMTAISVRLVQVIYYSLGMIVLRRWGKVTALWKGVRDGLFMKYGEL